MTKNDFQMLIDTKTPYEFKYNGKSYNLTFGKDSSGRDYIDFGLLYEGAKYYSIKELLLNAKIENHFLKEMLDVI